MATDQDQPRRGLLDRYPLYTKLAFLILLILLSTIPLAMIRGLVLERQLLSRTVAHEVSSSWGGEQRIVGPVLIVPYTETSKREVVNPHKKEPSDPDFIEKEIVEKKFLFALPEHLTIDGEVTPKTRYRGIYEVRLYTAQTAFSGRFAKPDFAALGIENPIEVHWDRARVVIQISDLTGSLNAIALQWGDASLPFAASGQGNQVFASLPNLDRPGPWPAAFSFQVDLNGSGSLGFLPLGQSTEVALRSAWPHPGFTGAFLPKVSEIDDKGFTARWEVSHLARRLPQQWTSDTANAPHLMQAAQHRGLTTRLVDPVDHYLKVERSVKYGLLFVVLVGAALTILEIVSGGRLHFVQYGMIAAALLIFYLLFLSLSEVFGFSPAYLVAAAASVMLIALYTARIMGSLRHGGLVAFLLSVIYGYLYWTLRSEDYALLSGSLVLFVALAAAMYVTRNVDWHALGRSVARSSPSGRATEA